MNTVSAVSIVTANYTFLPILSAPFVISSSPHSAFPFVLLLISCLVSEHPPFIPPFYLGPFLPSPVFLNYPLLCLLTHEQKLTAVCSCFLRCPATLHLSLLQSLLGSGPWTDMSITNITVSPTLPPGFLDQVQINSFDSDISTKTRSFHLLISFSVALICAPFSSNIKLASVTSV